LTTGGARSDHDIIPAQLFHDVIPISVFPYDITSWGSIFHGGPRNDERVPIYLNTKAKVLLLFWPKDAGTTSPNQCRLHMIERPQENQEDTYLTYWKPEAIAPSYQIGRFHGTLTAKSATEATPMFNNQSSASSGPSGNAATYDEAWLAALQAHQIADWAAVADRLQRLTSKTTGEWATVPVSDIVASIEMFPFNPDDGSLIRR
jgi:hypothetical protein